MGCTPSAPTPPSEALSDKFGPPPPIPVDIGTGIRHQLNSTDVTIIFIFGGPASQKGLVIQELTGSFNFVSISVEDIVFNYLPNRVANTIESIGEIQEILKRDQGILTVDWILSMISAKLSTSMGQRFVVDIVPTLATIMKADSYKSRTHDRSLENFERTHPITFALDISVLDEQELIAPNESAKEANNKKLSPEMSQFMKGIDDIDKGRLEKRLDEYHQCAEPFLRYFHKTRRIARLSLHTGSFANLVPTCRDVMLEFGFTLSRRDDHVLVFSAQVVHENLDLDYYKLKRVDIAELCKPSDGLVAQIAALHKYIASHGRPGDNFLVIMRNVKKNDITSKRINFMEKKSEAYLDEFIKNKQHDRPPKSRCRTAINCVSSSRQIILFLEPFSSTIAQNIASLYNKMVKRKSSTGVTSMSRLQREAPSSRGTAADANNT
ncbi:unnamed protein product [Caenorhabditis bovis]|uniref:Adenylate kinase n=1 Tax=Caenorhabditis bovis TaxID=2654633 RepID=A0A8S1F9Q3_9PELO|nr:unnamed protein product [Caenorhabditis bovis]